MVLSDLINLLYYQNELCQHCRRIAFHDEAAIISLFAWLEIAASDRCVLCQLIRNEASKFDQTKVPADWVYHTNNLSAWDIRLVEVVPYRGKIWRYGRNSRYTRGIATHSSSDQCYKLAAEWINTCLTTHPECRLSQHKAPTRLLNISSSEVFLQSYLGDSVKYVTLSYCWGSSYFLTTTMENLGAHSCRIPMADMPKTVQDAVAITHRLGLQYLWIDALCIVQDSQEDWLAEMPKMTDYYRDSVFTISALDSSSSDSGILKERNMASSITLHDQTCIRLTASIYYGTFGTSISASPLSKRAWALQERLLSTRILHYSLNEILWECQQASFREGRKGNYRTHQGTNSRSAPSLGDSGAPYLEHPLFKRHQTSKEILSSWYRVVSEYTSRNLTKKSDKLPAIAGLALLFQNRLSYTYLSGIWKEDLVLGLLWELPLESVGITSSTMVDNPDMKSMLYQAPSWSWAAVDGQVKFLYRADSPYSHFPIDAHLVNFEPNTMGADSRSQMVVKSLVFQVLTKAITWKTVEPISIQNQNGSRRIHLINDAGEVIGEGTLDGLRFNSEVGRIMRIGSTALGQLTEFVLCIINIPSKRCHNQWRRVGIGKLITIDYEGTVEDGSMFKNCKPEEIILI